MIDVTIFTAHIVNVSFGAAVLWDIEEDAFTIAVGVELAYVARHLPFRNDEGVQAGFEVESSDIICELFGFLVVV